MINYIIIFSAIAIATQLYVYIQVRERHPISLSIALIGPSGMGKTVYLTLVFYELESGTISGLTFAPAGQKTTERVANDIAALKSYQFPPKTSYEEQNQYDAVATYKRVLFPQRYRIQITDYAGERLNEFNPYSEQWLHRTDYFGYVVSADAVLFMIDCTTLLADKPETISQYETLFVTTLHRLIEISHRDSDPTESFKTPVGLIFSKSDILQKFVTEERNEDMLKKIIVDKLDHFISVCRNRCRNFQFFFVSSLGHIPPDDTTPPNVIEPDKILDPILWILGK